MAEETWLAQKMQEMTTCAPISGRHIFTPFYTAWRCVNCERDFTADEIDTIKAFYEETDRARVRLARMDGQAVESKVTQVMTELAKRKYNQALFACKMTDKRYGAFRRCYFEIDMGGEYHMQCHGSAINAEQALQVVLTLLTQQAIAFDTGDWELHDPYSRDDRAVCLEWRVR